MLAGADRRLAALSCTESRRWIAERDVLYSLTGAGTSPGRAWGMSLGSGAGAGWVSLFAGVSLG